MSLSKYGYFSKRSRDSSLTKKQREYAKSFTAGANNSKGKPDTKSGINKLAYIRGQKWQSKQPRMAADDDARFHGI